MTNPITSDTHLWNSVQGESTDAFETVVSRYQGLVSAIAFSQTGDFGLSQDVAQETFVTAWKNKHQLRDVSKLGAWLCTIARRIASSTWKKSQPRERPLSIDDLPTLVSSDEDPSDAASALEETQLVWHTLEHIPEIYRDVLVLYYRQGKSMDEVASCLEISNETARQRLARGRDMLREQVACLIEDVLVKTKPDRKFTRTVMATIAGIASAAGSTATASAAALSTTAVSTAVGSKILVQTTSTAALAKAAAGTGTYFSVGMLGAWIGTFFGAAGGLLGAFLGYKMPALVAPTMTERRYIERSSKWMMLAAILFTAITLGGTLLTQYVGYRTIAVVMMVSSSVLFTIGIVASSLAMNAQIKKIRLSVRPEDDPNPSRWSQWSVQATKSYYHGRKYRSPTTLFGIPLLDIQFSDLQNCYSNPVPKVVPMSVARGWIALGDHAFGMLFSFGYTSCSCFFALGGVTIAPLAIGGVALGLIAFGGIALAGLSLGGLAIGYLAFGGLGIGYDAIGGYAVGWHSATGGGALARYAAFGGGARATEFAVGGSAIAKEANTAAAEAVINQETYKLWLESATSHWPLAVGAYLLVLALLITIILSLTRVAYKKKTIEDA